MEHAPSTASRPRHPRGSPREPCLPPARPPPRAGLAPAAARAYETRHVVIVVVDGGALQRDLRRLRPWRNVPRQGLDLAPQGCRGTSWNAGVTSTVPGHAAILSGAYQALANDGSERPHLPLVFEYYRAATGAPASQAWFFSDKPKLDVMSNSDDPAYGDSLGASVDTSCPTDSAVVARAEAVAARRAPGARRPEPGPDRHRRAHRELDGLPGGAAAGRLAGVRPLADDPVRHRAGRTDDAVRDQRPRPARRRARRLP